MPGTSHQGGPWLRQSTRSAELILGYLALHGDRTHHREKLAAILWPDAAPEKSRNAFRTTLWRLRSNLEPEGVRRGSVLLVDPAGEVGLNWDGGIWCDVREFRRATGGPHSTDTPSVALDGLRRATDLYRGDLLESFYEDWVVVERETLKDAQLHALDILMLAAERDGDWDTALDYGRRILADDPLRETIHRRMISLYMRCGDRTLALRQFDHCARVLKQELNVEPMPETRAAQLGVLTGTFEQPAAPDRLAEELQVAVLCVRDALSRLERARARYVAHTDVEISRQKSAGSGPQLRKF